MSASTRRAISDLVRLLGNSRIVDSNRLIGHGRELAADLDLPCDPVGAGNSKTGTPGTYRPVGPSCPPCPLDASCYARFGPVGIHQARASTDAAASVTAAMIAIVAAIRADTVARLHVSGDFYRHGHLSTSYLQLLIECAEVLRIVLAPTNPLAWTYTHVSRDEFEPWRLKLERVGIEVLYSGQHDVGGALVYPHERIAELRTARPDVTVVACPAQTRSVSCRDCGLCWQARRTRLCIVFDPHGRGAPALRLLTTHAPQLVTIGAPQHKS